MTNVQAIKRLKSQVKEQEQVKAGALPKPGDKPYLLGHQAELFSRQEIKFKNKSPVKVAIAVQRPVVDISFLFVLLHTRHPAGVGKSVCV